MHPPLLGRQAGDGPRHARAGSTVGAQRLRLPRRYRRRVALLVALLVVPTAATVSDVAGLPIAAGGSASLHKAQPAPTLSATGLDATGPSTSDAQPSLTTQPVTRRITAAAGETIWSIAARSGVAPGAALRHNRVVASDPDADTVDALAAGRPLERAETLIVPTQAPPGAQQINVDDLQVDDGPIADDAALAELEPIFDRWADHFGVPGDLLKALAWVESGWDNDSRSNGGGIGIGHLQPMRAQYLAEHVARMPLDPTVTVDNIALTAAQLRVLLDETPDVRSAVAAHRQGIIDTRLSGVDPQLDGYVEAVLTLRLRFA
jgi:hypothetical protein